MKAGKSCLETLSEGGDQLTYHVTLYREKDLVVDMKISIAVIKIKGKKVVFDIDMTTLDPHIGSGKKEK